MSPTNEVLKFVGLINIIGGPLSPALLPYLKSWLQIMIRISFIGDGSIQSQSNTFVGLSGQGLAMKA